MTVPTQYNKALKYLKEIKKGLDRQGTYKKCDLKAILTATKANIEQVKVVCFLLKAGNLFYSLLYVY